MSGASRICRFVTLAVCALVLAACGSTKSYQAAEHDFPEAAAKVFAAGLSTVQERYITPVNLPDLAFEGVRGLGAIDPDLTVLKGDDSFVLLGQGEVKSHFPLPAEDTPQAWAELTARITAAARRWFPEIHRSQSEKLYEAVFDGIISKLDTYTRYAGREEAKRHRERRDGFGGIGVRLAKSRSGARLTKVTPAAPADEAGLRIGDLILKIDETPLAGLSVRAMIGLLRGRRNSDVALTVRRGLSEPFVKTIRRRHIVPATVNLKVHDDVLLIKISSFNQNTAISAADKISRLIRGRSSDFKGAVLDLRGNPGGLLRQSIQFANLFIAQGNIVSTMGRHPDSIHHYQADGADVLEGVPLVVLVDGKSASAAEIVAAALQDRNRAVVVGTSSFGKGTVQTVVSMPNEGELTMTWSHLVTPGGSVLHGLGVHPEVCTSSAAAGTGHPASLGRNGERAAPATLEAPRPAPDAGEQRAKLRRACPPEPHSDEADMEVATKLLADDSLFRRALGSGADTAEVTPLTN